MVSSKFFQKTLISPFSHDKTITIKPTQRTYDRQDIKTPRTVNESLGYFRPSQEQDKVRTLPESNGSTGYVIPQLKRVTFRYCRYSKSSLGVREFIENSKNSGFYEKFLADNPSTAVYDKIYDDGNSAKILVEWCGKDKCEIFEVSHLSESDIGLGFFIILDLPPFLNFSKNFQKTLSPHLLNPRLCRPQIRPQHLRPNRKQNPNKKTFHSRPMEHFRL